MAHVAVVGGGAAGLGAALVLTEAGVDVTLIEQEAMLGGHCFGVDVPLSDGGYFRIDAGVSDFNMTSFTAVRALLERLGLSWHPVCQDAAFAGGDGRPLWSLLGGRAIAHAPFRDFDAFVAENTRFRSGCIEVLSDPRFASFTLGQYLADAGYDDEVASRAILPRAAGCFPMPDRDPATYLATAIVSFWAMHGIVGANPPTRMVVEGGMCSWPEVLGAWLEKRGSKLWRSTRVQGISRREGRVRLRLEHGDGRHSTAWFEHVVLATPPPRVLAALEDPTPDEAALLGALHWQRARVCVHQDARLLGRDREAWGAYNYVVPRPGEGFERPTITFWPNKLASLPREVPDTFVTMNPHREPDPRRVLTERFFVHPSNARPREGVVSRLAELQGEAGTWFAGAWSRAPHVHEQALRTGLEVGEQVVRALAEPRASGRRRAMHWEDVVRASPLLHTVDAMVLEELRPEVERREFAAGEVVCREGEPSDAMLFVGTGRLEVLVGGERVSEIPPGEVVGEIGLLDDGPRTATLRALEPFVAWRLERARFEALRRDARPAALALVDATAQQVCARLRSQLGPLAPCEASSFRGAAAHRLEPARVEELLGELIARLELDSEAAAILSKWGEPLRFEDEPLWTRGAAAGGLLVLSGVVRVGSPEEGAELWVTPGELAGAEALLDGGRNPFSARAVGAVVGLGMDAAAWRRLRATAPGLVLHAIAARQVALLMRSHRYMRSARRPEASVRPARQLG
jgi:predicted NAD/FAD-binding protein/CRP-like cAMP-binding protein